MAKALSVAVSGVDTVRKYLKLKNFKINEAVARAMNKAGLYVEGEVKESIAGNRTEPRRVDTGRLLGSVHSSASEDEAIVYSNVEYAPFIEYGTSTIPKGKHFRNSVNRSKGKVKELIKAEIKKSLS